MAEKVTLEVLWEKYQQGRKLVMLTAYSQPEALLLDQAGVDLVLVGDSLANCVLGYESTVPVTMGEMLHHVKAARRGVRRALLVADLPFLSYQVSREQAVANAGRMVKQGGADAVKVEGAGIVVEAVAAIAAAGIPVMGHLGLTPQTAALAGSFRVRGRTAAAALALAGEAKRLAAAGAFAIVLECLPAETAAAVTRAAGVPTIGIGAGPHCSGQVLVTADLTGALPGPKLRFVRRYADLAGEFSRAVGAFIADVEGGSFPGPAESFKLDEEEAAQLKRSAESRKAKGKR